MDTVITADTLQQSNASTQTTSTQPTQQQVRQESQKFQTIIDAENTPIMHIKAVFPFDFFPNEVIIDKTKVTIIKKYFFWTRQVTTILISDVLNVTVNHGLLFGSLAIADRFFAQDPFSINYLWKQDAARAASVIQGMVLASKEQIDVKKIPSAKLAQHAESVGMPEAGRESEAL